MNFKWEHSEFYIISGNKCHISNDYLFQVFTVKPRTEKKCHKDRIIIRNTEKVGRGWHEA